MNTRRFLRLCLLIAGWTAFGLLWLVALQRVDDRTVEVTIAVVATAVVVNATAATLVLLGRHDRFEVPPSTGEPSVDRLGRRLVSEAGVRTDQVVVVTLRPDGAKEFRREEAAGAT